MVTQGRSMALFVIGMSHKSAPIDVREYVAKCLKYAQANVALRCNKTEDVEYVFVNTCNRSEIYVKHYSLKHFLFFLRAITSIDFFKVQKYCYFYRGPYAIKHLFSVVSGLDSLVLGETEVLGQVKRSYDNACTHGSVAKYLSRLFQKSFAVAKQVRSSTNIGHSPLSVAHIATKLALNIFQNLANKKVLIVGAGDTAALVVKHLVKYGVKELIIANRSRERSLRIAQQYPHLAIDVINLTDIAHGMLKVDICISQTNASLPIIGKGLVETSLKKRNYRPLFMVDLALPRDIEPEVNMLEGTFLYCVDDLAQIANKNGELRTREIEPAIKIIHKAQLDFIEWLCEQRSVNTINDFSAKCIEHKKRALNEAHKQLKAGMSADLVVERLAAILVKRIIHTPLVEIKNACLNGDLDTIDSVRKLFQLDKKL